MARELVSATTLTPPVTPATLPPIRTTLSSTQVLEKPPGCYQCRYFNQDSNFKPNCLGFVPDYYPSNPVVAFFAEAAGQNEKVTRIPMSGGSGQVLNEAVEKAGYSRSAIAIFNVLRGQPVGPRGEINRYPTADLRRDAEIACRQYDSVSNNPFQPKGLRDFNPTHYLITFHPSNVLRTPSLRRIFEGDVAKAFRLSVEGRRFLVFLGETSRELVLPGKIHAGVFKCRGHWGALDWNEYLNRDWSRYNVRDEGLTFSGGTVEGDDVPF